MNNLQIAVLLPCHNEAGAIGDTVTAFKNAIPTATIYVYDNNSTDATVEEAKAAGAIVRFERRQGKGEVVRRMFADVDADIYIMADGDNTYDASVAPELIKTLIDEQLDMIVGTRSKKKESYPIGHILGNTFFSKLINNAFSSNLTDVFSGYRIMTHRFVKSVPVFSDGFQIETELTVHSLQHKLPIKEIATKYISRPEGTKSKLSTFGDGFKILNFIFFLLRNVRPMLFFFSLSLIFMLASLGLGIPVVYEFIETGLVKRFPTAILASSLGVISVLLSFTGLILDNVRQARLEVNRLHYLSLNKS
ncbi:putative glycosyltransferase [Vibrio halioticoli NBRC 102217]|uniref:Putative glycosyltransferase n=1 Tax=Vibrio halioticoli NBRC 102217 TaxID=1219072 RepID=V5F5E2_9VIBR|nr:glycosyltransferase family 2 protein [Vibrio halioticoli]GAD90769.1 putative glycosyltransferase [Vibrio halioticoli NBRC 102217]